MTVEAILLIESSGGDTSNQIIVAEPDEILNLDSNGEPKSDFQPGDLFYFQIHKSPDVVISDIIPTNGSVQSLGSVTRDFTTDYTFASRDPQSPPNLQLPKIPSRNFKINYLGRPGDVIRETAFNGIITLHGDINLVPFLGRISYKYVCNSYVLRTPQMTLGEDESYPITIVIYIESTTGVSDACSNS